MTELYRKNPQNLHVSNYSPIVLQVPKERKRGYGKRTNAPTEFCWISYLLIAIAKSFSSKSLRKLMEAAILKQSFLKI